MTEWYFDATESNAHADIAVLYPTKNHPELSDAEQVRPIVDPDLTIPRYGEGDSADSETSGFEYDEFASQHWRTRVSQIESGDMDSNLSAIADQTTSNAVAEAVEARQSKWHGGE